MARNIERVVTFGPEMAGERVGWVSSGRVRGDDDENGRPWSLNLVTATVSQNGAWFGYETLQNPDGEKSLPIATQYGFLAVSAISTILASKEPHDWQDEFNLSYLQESDRGRDKDQLLDRGVNRGLYVDEDEGADWARNKAELLELLKGKLADSGFKDRYPQLYYWLNGSVARFDNYGGNPFAGFSLDELLLPDKSMKKKTADQIMHADGVVETLTRMAAHDDKMRKRLTVFSDIPKETVPDRFIDNRNYAAGGEKVIQEHITHLAVRQLVYLPIGFRPNGRTWPYMDASEPDAEKAYGRELAGLKRGDIEPADFELKREITELEKRRQYADQGLQRLNQLSQSEAA